MPRVALKNRGVYAPRSFFLLNPLDIHPDIKWMKGIIISIPNTSKGIYTYSINWDHNMYNGKFDIGQLRTEISKDNSTHLDSLKKARDEYDKQFPPQEQQIESTTPRSSNVREVSSTSASSPAAQTPLSIEQRQILARYRFEQEVLNSNSF